ncbi:MAG TPA: hypothetical protein VNE21_08440, partial [Mycobacteriales bacterium]|nr:hypothetical protein [Mycobacteriales bacterium]
MDVGVATAEPVPTPSQPRRGWTRGWGAKSWPVVLLFVVVTGILYWRPLIGRGDFLPTDILRPQPPWNTAQTLPQAPYNWILGDTLDNYTDVEYFVSQAKAGRLTHWNPYVASGVPLYQAPNYYPLNFLFYLLPMPYAWGAHAALRTFLAMLFMFLFLRQLKVRQWSAGLGGVAFGLTGFNVVWLGWQQSWVSVFIPALFWTAERVIQRPTGRRACGLGLVWAAMVLGGFPAVAGMSVYLLAGYTALRLWQTRRSEGSWARPARAVLWLAGGFVLGTLLTGVYTVPFLDFYAHADLGYRSSLGRLTLDPRYLVTALVPNAYGHEYLPNDWWGPSSNYVEIQFYGGILTLLLAASSLLLRRRDPDGPGRGLSWLFLGTCAVVVMLAFGHPLGLLDTVSKLPIFSNSAPGR